MSNIQTLIRERSPLLAEDSAVFQELLTFFSHEARIPPNVNDLKDFLDPKRKYKVVKISETSFIKCAYVLVDDYPECATSLGMLRYYRAPKAMLWGDVEKAENIIASSLTTDVYGWTPDSFTGFENAGGDKFELTVIFAY